jgi:hypothetical protein
MDYHDKDQFDNSFRDLYIGKHPKSGRSSLLVLRFDFSTVSGAHTYETTKQQFDRMVNCELQDFLRRSHARDLASKELQVAPLEEIGALHMSRVLAALPDIGEVSFLDTYMRVISGGIMTGVAHQFGAAEARQLGKDASTTWNLLYFFGVLTHAPGSLRLRVPNSTMINVVRTIFASMPINPDVVSDH